VCVCVRERVRASRLWPQAGCPECARGGGVKRRRWQNGNWISNEMFISILKLFIKFNISFSSPTLSLTHSRPANVVSVSHFRWIYSWSSSLSGVSLVERGGRKERDPACYVHVTKKILATSGSDGNRLGDREGERECKFVVDCAKCARCDDKLPAKCKKAQPKGSASSTEHERLRWKSRREEIA
jgi:hypothetical protein